MPVNFFVEWFEVDVTDTGKMDISAKMSDQDIVDLLKQLQDYHPLTVNAFIKDFQDE